MEILIAENHQEDVLLYLRNLYQAKTQCDVIMVTTDAVHFFAHRLVLAATSGYFQSIILSKQSFLLDNAISVAVESKYLQPLLDFMYTGQLCVSMETRLGLLNAASQLRMESAKALLLKAVNVVNTSSPWNGSASIIQVIDNAQCLLPSKLSVPCTTVASDSAEETKATYDKSSAASSSVTRGETVEAENLGKQTPSGQTVDMSVLGSDQPITGLLCIQGLKQEPESEDLECGEGVVPSGHSESNARQTWADSDVLFSVPLPQNLHESQDVAIDKGTKSPVTRTQKKSSRRKKDEANLTVKEELCEKVFVSKSGSSLTKCHCSVCGITFSLYAQLKRHMIKMHNCSMSEHYLGRLIGRRYARQVYQHSRYTMKVKNDFVHIHCLRCKQRFTQFSKWCLHFSQKHLAQRKYGVFSSHVSYLKMRRLRMKEVDSSQNRSKGNQSQRKWRLKEAVKCPSHFKTRSAMQTHLVETRTMSNPIAKRLMGQLGQRAPGLSGAAEGAFQCPECLEYLSSTQALGQHLSRTHKLTKSQANDLKSKLRCDEEGCSFSSDNLVVLKQHVSEAHPSHQFSCDECGSLFPLQFMLEKHKQYCHRVNMIKEEASVIGHHQVQLFTSSSALQLHQTSQLETQKDVKVDDTWMGDLGIIPPPWAHLPPFNPPVDQTRPSIKCAEAKPTASDNQCVKEVPSKCEPYKCDVCNSTFQKKYYLKRHMQKHSKDGLLSCGLCPREFYENCSLQDHINAKHKGNQFRCLICEKAFLTRYGLNNHLKFHSESFRHLCHHCGKGFVYKTTFDSHVAKHTGEKPYECDKCGNKFGHVSTLASHKKICGKVNRPHACDICGKKFKAARYLKEHERCHISPERYQCSKCGLAFGHRGTLYKHVQRNH